MSMKMSLQLLSSIRNLKRMHFTLISIIIISIFSISILEANLNKTTINQDEMKWLHSIKEPIKVGITSIPGQVIVGEDGRYRGFAIDLFRMIENSLNINFEYIYFDTWNDTVKAGIDREIDILFLAQKTEERLSYFDFTDYVLSQQNKIITKVGQHNNLTIYDLFGLKVAVSKGSAVYEYLKNSFKEINLVLTNSEEESLELVSKGIADASISEAVRTSYYLKKHNIENLRVSGSIDYNYYLRIASRNDIPILNMILTKAIEAIPEEDIQALYLKWGYVHDDDDYIDRQTLIYIGLAFGIIIPFTIYISFLNRDLKREAAKKEEALDELLTASKQIHHLKSIAEQEARTDDLTHALNKRGFKEKLKNELDDYENSGKVFSFLIADIDHFKRINDEMGHDTGDKVLSDFVKVIRDRLNLQGYIGRVGGEEFAIVFPDISLEKAIEITKQIRRDINSHIFDINDFTFQVTASFGITQVIDNDTSSSIFQRADELLYRSKSNGRDRISS